MAFEDSLIMSEILGPILNTASTNGNKFTPNEKLEACLLAYDEVRRPRTTELTLTSREMGDLLGYAHKEVGQDLVKMKANLDSRMRWIWDLDMLDEVKRGIETAQRILQASLG